MKFKNFCLLGTSLLLFAGCASAPETKTGAAKPKEEKCQVTGSNVPKRDCRNDVTVLPPSAIETVMPQLPSSAPRN